MKPSPEITPDAARLYLASYVVATATGRAILRDLGYTDVIKNPTGGDDGSTLRVVREVSAEFARRYAR